MTTVPWVTSCRHCLAWGPIVFNGICQECVNWRIWKREPCAGCGRSAPLKHQHCRLCHNQAKLQLGRMVIRGHMPEVTLNSWQLQLSFRIHDRRAKGRPRKLPPTEFVPATWQVPGQLALFPARPDYLRFERARHANPDNPSLIAALRVARDLAEAHGWARWILREINDGLLVLLSGHAPGDLIAYSDIVPIDQLGHNVGHTAEVLDQLGILHDDRTPAFDGWLQAKLATLAAPMAAEVETWANTLRDGGTRTKRRAEDTVRNYLHAALPHLTAWSKQYDHLRQVTRDDVKEAAAGLIGLPRKRALVALRSLFQFHKRAGGVFRDPTVRINAGKGTTSPPLPLRPGTLEALAEHATTPPQRVILALTAVHAARPMALRALEVQDVDLPNRRITIGGHARRLDELTGQLISRYLNYRRLRWPHTTNPHLILNEHTAQNQKPVSQRWLRERFPGFGVTLNQVRMDRQLEEALTRGPDALHLAAVFGISEGAAMRYANAARQLLATSIEQQR
ncbi:hypothetical protein ABZ769_30550 [Streptomyces olivoreticuli]